MDECARLTAQSIGEGRGREHPLTQGIFGTARHMKTEFIQKILFRLPVEKAPGKSTSSTNAARGGAASGKGTLLQQGDPLRAEERRKKPGRLPRTTSAGVSSSRSTLPRLTVRTRPPQPASLPGRR
jgi:hypothetical protein